MWNISVLKKIRFNYASILLLPVILFCNKSFASCVPNVPIELPGTSKTIYVSRDSSDPVLRGDYELSTLTITMTCDTAEETRGYRLIANPAAGSLSPSAPYGSDFSGNTAVVLSGGGLGLEVYETAEGHPPVWFDDNFNQPNAGFPASKTFNVTFGVDLVSIMGGTVTPGNHSFSGKFGLIYNPLTNDSYDVNMSNFSVFIIYTGCQLNGNQANLTWNNLSSADIISGVVPSQTAVVGADCGSVETPVSIKFSSSHGYVNAAQGIVRTDDDGSNNMGLQLTWDKTGLPINMNETTHDTLKDVQYFNVVTKPVAINPNNSIKSGTFNGTVTMMFSYR